MTKRTLMICALVLALAALPVLAASHTEKGSWTGWISDSHCGAGGANAKHTKACVEKCAKDGKVVFFNNADKTLYNLDEAGAKMALDHVGHEVTVTGSLHEGAITVEKIEMAAAK
jgi:hypothetical protein